MRSRSWEDDSELAGQLANATEPGHFNRLPRQRQSRRRNLVGKDEQRFVYTDQHGLPGEYLRSSPRMAG